MQGEISAFVILMDAMWKLSCDIFCYHAPLMGAKTSPTHWTDEVIENEKLII